MAGLIDGEGTVTMSNKRQAFVQISMTDRELLDEVAETFGGRVRDASRWGANDKPMYAWRLYGYRAESLLRALLPHLRTKRRQAELCLELFDFRRANPHTRGLWANYAYNRALRDRCDEFVREMRWLNQRGLHPAGL